MKSFEEFKEEMMGGGAPTNNVGDGKIAGTVEAGDDPVVRKKPTILARGKMPGARKRFKNGVDLINNIRNV